MLCACPQRSDREVNSVITFHGDCVKDVSGQMLSDSRRAGAGLGNERSPRPW